MKCLAVALLALGCACGAEPDGAPGPLVLTPDAELEQVTRDWAAQWSEATGLEVVVGPGGVPVRALNRVTTDGVEVCGNNTITDGVPVDIQIDMTPPARCVGWGYMVGHEIGHALAADPGHGEDGLMAQKPAIGVQLTVDADYVCDRVGCPSP